jgi:hypothetical protein
MLLYRQNKDNSFLNNSGILTDLFPADHPDFRRFFVFDQRLSVQSAGETFIFPADPADLLRFEQSD